MKSQGAARKLDVTFNLKSFSELILNVDDAPRLELMVVEGIAEISGVKLENNVKYCFDRFAAVVVFTYHGCSIVVFKRPLSKCVVSTETSMDALLNIHLSLEEYREEALRCNTNSPVTICVGGTQSGKLTGVETLLNYSLRQNPDEDRKIFYIDLNHSHNLLSVPGTLGACIVQNPPSVREGLLLNCKNPIVFSFEHTNPFDNILLYKYYICKLAALIKTKRELYPNMEVIINIPSWIQGSGYKLLLKTCQEFQVSHVIVFESCTAYNQLIDDLPPFVNIIHTPRILSTLVQLQPPRQRRLQTDSIFEYFFGTLREVFVPYRIEYKREDLNILSVDPVGSMGSKHKRPKLKMSPVDLDKVFDNQILGVLHVPPITTRKQEEFYKYPIQVYICLISQHRHTVEVLSPLPRKSLPLPLYTALTDQKLNHSYKSQKIVDERL